MKILSAYYYVASITLDCVPHCLVGGQTTRKAKEVDEVCPTCANGDRKTWTASSSPPASSV